MNNEGYNYVKKSKNLVTSITRITPVKNAACKLLIFSIRDHLFFLNFKRNACSLLYHDQWTEFCIWHIIDIVLLCFGQTNQTRNPKCYIQQGIQIHVISYGYISFAVYVKIMHLKYCLLFLLFLLCLLLHEALKCSESILIPTYTSKPAMSRHVCIWCLANSFLYWFF